jgi:hypothetical protein
MKIAVCSLSVGENYRNITQYGIDTRRNYCEKHGYTFIEEESAVDWTRHLAWSKIPLILKHLSSYDFLVWMDADSFVMNDTYKLEDFITRLLGDKDLMYTTGHNWVNTGVFFVKNTPFMKLFFQEAYKHTDQICWEQGAIDYLWRINWNNCKEKIIIVQNQVEFNSFWDLFSWGQFILHFPGCGEPNRPKESLRRMMNMFCPVKMDEDTKETFEFRLEWLKNEAEKDLKKAKKYGTYIPLFVHEIPGDILGDIEIIKKLY